MQCAGASFPKSPSGEGVKKCAARPSFCFLYILPHTQNTAHPIVGAPCSDSRGRQLLIRLEFDLFVYYGRCSWWSAQGRNI